MEIVKVCLLHGQRCHFSSYKYIPRKSSFQVKVCRANFPCSQQYLTSVWLLSAAGPCEKINLCPIPSEPCKLAQNEGVKLPRLRWINCWAWCQARKEVLV